MQTIFLIIKKLKYVGYLFWILYIYQGLLGAYPLIAIYHIRAGLEWISIFIPIHVLYTIASVSIAFSLLTKIKNV